MRRPSAGLIGMGQEYEIMRDGICVATVQGLPSKDGTEIVFPQNTHVKADDSVVGKISRAEFIVGSVAPVMSGGTVLSIKAVRRIDKRDDHSHSVVTQHIGTVHGAVAGRDLHGDVTVNVTVGDVLKYLGNEIEKTASPEEKKTLLAKLGELSKHPIIVNLASVVVSHLTKG
jgi:hypothetical protein